MHVRFVKSHETTVSFPVFANLTSVGMTMFFLDYDLCQPDVHLPWGVTKKYSPGVVSHVGLHGGIGHRVAQDTSERHYPGVILNPSKVQWSKTQQGLIFLKKSWNSWKFKQVIPSPIKKCPASSCHHWSIIPPKCSTGAWPDLPMQWHWIGQRRPTDERLGSGRPSRFRESFCRGSWEESEVNVDFTQNGDFFGIPSGKHTKNDGKSPCLMGKLTISMVIFNSKLLQITRG